MLHSRFPNWMFRLRCDDTIPGIAKLIGYLGSKSPAAPFYNEQQQKLNFTSSPLSFPITIEGQLTLRATIREFTELKRMKSCAFPYISDGRILDDHGPLTDLPQLDIDGITEGATVAVEFNILSWRFATDGDIKVGIKFRLLAITLLKYSSVWCIKRRKLGGSYD